MTLEDLFPMEVKNILPKDGEVIYFGKVFDNHQSSKFFELLKESIEWENDRAIIFGKLIETKRKVAWYGDQEFEYTYSNITKKAKLWHPILLELKKQIEQHTKSIYNSCLLNLYHDGNEGMAWHSDGEKDLRKDGSIASLTFGAERKFAFKHKESKEVVSLILENGSLLDMKGKTQTYWLHRLPPTKKLFGVRINLTFRYINY